MLSIMFTIYYIKTFIMAYRSIRIIPESYYNILSVVMISNYMKYRFRAFFISCCSFDVTHFIWVTTIDFFHGEYWILCPVSVSRQHTVRFNCLKLRISVAKVSKIILLKYKETKLHIRIHSWLNVINYIVVLTMLSGTK